MRQVLTIILSFTLCFCLCFTVWPDTSAVAIDSDLKLGAALPGTGGQANRTPSTYKQVAEAYGSNATDGDADSGAATGTNAATDADAATGGGAAPTVGDSSAADAADADADSSAADSGGDGTGNGGSSEPSAETPHANADSSAADAASADTASNDQDQAVDGLEPLTSLAAPLASGSYVIRPAFSSSRVLDVEGATNRQGARLIIWPCQVQQNQVFRITADSSGYYSISSALSGQALDVEGGWARNGASLVQWPLKPGGGNSNQLWQIVGHGDGSYSFLSALALPSASYPGLALDISGAADANGSPAMVWQYHAGMNQRFYLVATDRPNAGPSSANITDGIYSIGPGGDSSLRMDISQASVAGGAAAILWSSHDGLNQLFYLVRQPDGYHAIISMNSSMVLDVSKANVVPATAIIQWPWQDSDNQKWSVTENADGSFRVLSKHSGLPLDILSNRMRVNTAVCLGQPAISSSQDFRLSAAGDTGLLPASLLNKCCVISPFADRSRQLDISNASYSEGAAVIAWPSHDAANQRFELLQVTADSYALRSAHSGRYLADSGSRLVQLAIGPSLPTDASMLWRVKLIIGGYMLINAGSGNALTYGSGVGTQAGAGAGTQAGALTTSAPQDSIYQAFALSESPVLLNGNYRLNTPAGLRLDFSQNGSVPGATVYLWTGHNSSNQKFRLQAVGSTVVLGSPTYNTALDIEGASANEGARAIVWGYTAAANQRFFIVPSGDGWYYLRAAFSPHPYLSADADASGATLHVSNDVSRAQRFRFEPTSLSSTDIANSAASALHSASGGRWVSTFGGFNISPAASANLQNTINSLSARGWEVGLVMVDINSGKGVAYNADWNCYSASSIKGPYVASLAAQNPALLSSGTASVMERTITVSDNNSYASLRSNFGPGSIQNWCRQIGVDANKLSDWYGNYSARDLGLLWTRNYEYFFGDAPYHGQVRSWYRSPLNSPIANTVGRYYESYSKPGWHYTMGISSTNDAGIVLAPNGCYLLAIMTNAPANFESVQSLAWALDAIHNEM